MADFARKTMMGYSSVRGGYSDPECTHVILTKEEYDQILREKAQAEQSARDVKYKADKEISEVKRTADYNVRQCADDARRVIEGMETELEAERTESAYQRDLNANLLRIARERANADRKLRPKKEHTGYVVLSSVEKEYRYRDRGSWKSVKLWETALETPYSIDFTERQVKAQIKELADDEGPHLVKQLGIQGYCGQKYEDMLAGRDWLTEEEENNNIMLEKRMRANYRSGYWEVLFFHTKPLGIVPKDMRAC